MPGDIDMAGFLSSIIETIPYGILMLDPNGRVILYNELALAHLEIKSHKKPLLKKDLLYSFKSVPDLSNKINNCLDKKATSFNLINVNVKGRFLKIRGRTNPKGILITTEDITRAKATEVDALNAMLEGQESERQRLAKEIHDGIGPLMSTIKLNLDAVKLSLDNMPEKTAKKVEAMDELLLTVASDLRSISHALMPSAIVDFGLVSALENLCNKANQSEKVEVKFYASGMTERLDQIIELGLFRIAQEALNNAFKHSRATTISLQLIRYPDHLALLVEDNGIGFSKDHISNLIDKGIGLRNIKTRTKSLGGILNIEAQPGRGVLVSIDIPL